MQLQTEWYTLKKSGKEESKMFVKLNPGHNQAAPLWWGRFVELAYLEQWCRYTYKTSLSDVAKK